MRDTEFEKSKAFIVADIIDYGANSILIRNILRKTTGNVTVVAFDAGEAITGKTSAFDTFILIIEGQASITVDDHQMLLGVGHAIIIPAHAVSAIRGIERFKMLSTVVKSGYEDID